MKIKSLYITYMGLTEPLLRSQAVNYIRLLGQKGVSAHILSFEKKEYITKGCVQGIRKDLAEAGIRWSFLAYHKKPQIISKPYDIIRGMFFAFCIVASENIEVIHARGTMSAIIGILPVLFLRKKLIFDVRGLMAEEYLDAGFWKKNSFTYRFVNWLERYFMKRADEVIVLNKKVAALLSERGSVRAGNLTVIPTCVDLSRFNIRAKDRALASAYSLGQEFILMYVGSVGTWYMLPEMIDFYRELINERRDSAFFILSQIGRREIEDRMGPGLQGKIVIDSASPERVADFLNFADAGISFIKPCFSKIASCPTKFGEYLACGLPVIINRGIGDTADIVEENRIGVVVEEFTPAEYRRKISELKALLKEGQALTRRCRQVAEKYFSLEEGAGRYLKVYSRIAAG